MKGLLYLLLAVATPAFGQGVVISAPADTSTFATKTELTAAQSTIMAAMPQPATAVPPAEQVNPTLGTSTRYRRQDDPQPRITRAGTCALTTGGVCSVTWATALSSAPNLVLEPINTSATQPIVCNPAATPTTTGASIKCWQLQTTLLSLAIVTTGLTLTPAVTAPVGTVVQITAIPPTQ